jgi:hypothetical protein
MVEDAESWRNMCALPSAGTSTTRSHEKAASAGDALTAASVSEKLWFQSGLSVIFVSEWAQCNLRWTRIGRRAFNTTQTRIQPWSASCTGRLAQEGFQNMTGPVASGWSGCRVGFAPTGKRRLVTAHTLSGHSDRDGVRRSCGHSDETKPRQFDVFAAAASAGFSPSGSPALRKPSTMR